jgi:16S rRNA (cytosine967-C5)-methyltransferase
MQQSAIEGISSRLAAVDLVSRVIDDEAALDDLTDPHHGLPAYRALPAREQLLAKAIALTTLRHHNRINFILKKLWDRKPPQKARFLIHSLEIAVSQIVFMQVPASAAVNLAVTMIRQDNRTTRFASFANAVLRGLTRRQEDLIAASAHVQPFPDWMAKALVRDHGKAKFALLCSAIQKQGNVDINFKPGVDLPIPGSIELPGNMKRITNTIPVHEIAGYQAGGWWVQNVAAAQAANLLGNVTGADVADLCAAPGGKTMQLASRGANVTAVDISHKRLRLLHQNLERTGLKANIVEADILDWLPGQLFDAILLDTPCTATGTIRRHPDVMWNKNESAMASLIALQQKLVEKAATLLKPGGKLVYANCSLFKSEGENLVAKLSNDHLHLDPVLPGELPGLEFCINGQGCFRSLPHYLETGHFEYDGMDGFFAARFISKP